LTDIVMPVELSNCAVLFGTPIDRDEFMDKAGESPPSDYLRIVLRGQKPSAVWKEYYQSVAEAAFRLASTASNFGAKVYRRATIRDFAEASVAHECLILLAHWRGATYLPDDLLAAPQEIVDFVEGGSHPVLALLQGTEARVLALTDALNRAVSNGSIQALLPPSVAAMARPSKTLGKTLSRDMLDDVFEGLLAPGNRVELFDGLHSPADMEAALCQNFNGVLDLATCNSEALAIYLDLHRGNTIRHLHWPDLIDPVPQYILIAETLKRQAVFGGTYITTRLGVERDL
jgi:hypothetical protein